MMRKKIISYRRKLPTAADLSLIIKTADLLIGTNAPVNFRKASRGTLNKPETRERLRQLNLFLPLLQEITGIMTSYRNSHNISVDVEMDIVTKADLEINSLIENYISANYSGDMIISEENETVFQDKPKAVWIYDPLDGTKTFKEGGRNCCFVLSRMEINKDDKLAEGFSIVWEPFNQVLTIGISGIGVIVAGNRKFDRINLFKKGLFVNTNSYIQNKLNKENDFMLHALPFNIAKTHKGSGSVELMHVVTGKTDIYLRSAGKLWDFLPGAFICHIAGRTVFFYDTRDPVFPLDFQKIINICTGSSVKSDRKIKKVA
ncbi:MAG: hypothetical protein PHV30_09685, partial [Candidatus Margulisbacteria bacterium]|nr:hypothetical protein [Candidatus Margulisiibacteriota bacterium]